ncbi:MAG: anti-sigma-factor antagonist [Acidimicrobiales bacterium]|nr:anti-sigma-factor antagonist [Acidimicrobiales bacterium]
MSGEAATFDLRELDDGMCLVATGEIDMSSGPSFAAALRRLMTTQDEAVVDLSGVTFMDSTGLNVLCAAAARDRVRLRGVPRHVRRIIAITSLEGTFVIDPEEAAR